MPELLYTDIQQLVAVKLCFFLFISAALWGIYKKYTPGYFAGITGLFCAIGYYFFVKGRELMFWGLNGDEVTISAMYTMMAQGSLLADFGYTHLPPFYPPGWFWLFGSLGRLLDINGVQIAKIAAVTTILLTPILIYWVQKLVWEKRIKKNLELPGTLAWLLSALGMFVVIDWDAIIIKPYQFLSAIFVIIWTSVLMYLVHKEKLNWKNGGVLAVSGAIIFITYYFWFFLVAIGASLFNFFYKEKISWQKYKNFAFVGGATIFLAAPFWLPLARSYKVYGTENWQFGYLLLKWLGTHGPTVSFSLRSLVLLFGIVTLIYFRKRFYIRILLSLFVAGYVWQIMGLTNIFYYAAPLQESKGFYFFNRAVLVFAASYGISHVWKWVKQKYYHSYKNWGKSFQIVALILFAPTLFFGHFVDEPLILDTFNKARSLRPEIKNLITFLENKNTFDTVTLHSGITELHAFLPMNSFVYFNMNNSHPAALFSERKLVIEELSLAKDPTEFFYISQHNQFGPIDRFVFLNQPGDVYPVYFRVENFPNASKEKIISIKKDLISEEYFNKVYEKDQYVVFERKITTTE